MKRICWHCGGEIEEKRLSAVPTTHFCKSCIEVLGDVKRTSGIMHYPHKTGAEIILSTEVGEAAMEQLRRHSRRGVHAQLPFSNRENPRTLSSAPPTQPAEFDSIRTTTTADRTPTSGATNLLPARCHPERPRVTITGLCVECAVTWYAERAKAKERVRE